MFILTGGEQRGIVRKKVLHCKEGHYVSHLYRLGTTKVLEQILEELLQERLPTKNVNHQVQSIFFCF